MAKGGQGKSKGKNKTSNNSSNTNYSSGLTRTGLRHPPKVYIPNVDRTTRREPVGTVYHAPSASVGLVSNNRKKKIMKRRVGSMANSAYCMKCRRKVEIKNPRMVVMRNGRPAISGTCPYCGTKVFKIGK